MRRAGFVGPEEEVLGKIVCCCDCDCDRVEGGNRLALDGDAGTGWTAPSCERRELNCGSAPSRSICGVRVVEGGDWVGEGWTWAGEGEEWVGAALVVRGVEADGGGGTAAEVIVVVGMEDVDGY